MLKRYENFLEEFDRELQEYFSKQKKYIKCRKGCTDCCIKGEYPFSRLEAEYLMYGFVQLDKTLKDRIRKNIADLKREKENFKGERFEYKCPFLLDGECALYERRGIVCRTFGLAYLQEDNRVRLPHCANIGLNYAEVYNAEKGEVLLNNPVKKDLRTDSILRSKTAEKYNLECGEIRPLIDWF